MAAKRYRTTKRELTRAQRDARAEATPPEGEPGEGPTSARPPAFASTRYSVIPTSRSDGAHPTLATLNAYLDVLPDGLASYPEAGVRGATVRGLLEDSRAGLDSLAGLPPALERLVRRPPRENDWVPVVQLCALHAAAYDGAFSTHGGLAAYEEWTFERNLRLLKSPTYEALVAVQNPELLLMAYHARWSTFYRNCPLDVMQGATGSVVLRLSYPSDCWPEISRISLAAGFRAGLVVAGAKSPEVTVKALSPRVARFDVRWR